MFFSIFNQNYDLSLSLTSNLTCFRTLNLPHSALRMWNSVSNVKVWCNIHNPGIWGKKSVVYRHCFEETCLILSFATWCIFIMSFRWMKHDHEGYSAQVDSSLKLLDAICLFEWRMLGINVTHIIFIVILCRVRPFCTCSPLVWELRKHTHTYRLGMGRFIVSDTLHCVESHGIAIGVNRILLHW